jgi:hypothetical protein
MIVFLTAMTGGRFRGSIVLTAFDEILNICFVFSFPLEDFSLPSDGLALSPDKAASVFYGSAQFGRDFFSIPPMQSPSRSIFRRRRLQAMQPAVP